MAKILIASLLKQPVSPFSNGYFSFGATDGGLANRTQYNRTISKATEVESVRLIMNTVSRISQNAGGYNSTSIYHVKGYGSTDLVANSIITDVNKVLCASDTQSSPNTVFTNQRRGPFGPLPPYNQRIYYFAGYNDVAGSYSADTTFIITPTDTATNATSVPAVRHVGVTLFNSLAAWLIGGYTTGGGATATIYKYIFATDSPSTLAAVDPVSCAQGYGVNSSTHGYKCLGAASGKSVRKINFSTDVLSTTTSGTGSADASMYTGSQFVSESTGYLWTGYRSSTLARTLHLLTFATDAWADRSYTPGDVNSGWVQGTSGA